MREGRKNTVNIYISCQSPQKHSSEHVNLFILVKNNVRSGRHCAARTHMCRRVVGNAVAILYITLRTIRIYYIRYLYVAAKTCALNRTQDTQRVRDAHVK